MKTENNEAVKSVKSKTQAKKIVPIKEKQTKTQMLRYISEVSALEQKTVQTVLQALEALLQSHLHNDGSGELTLHDLGIKIRRVTKPATEERKGRNPITGEEILIKAKPARQTVRVVALKKLKSMAETE